VRFPQVRSGGESGQSPEVRSGYGRWNDTENDLTHESVLKRSDAKTHHPIEQLTNQADFGS
jgi:hypothetical protein